MRKIRGGNRILPSLFFSVFDFEDAWISLYTYVYDWKITCVGLRVDGLYMA